VQGAYYAKSGRIVFAAANHGNAQEALETIQHEILGHFGLDLFRAADKQRILDFVKDASQTNPELKADFDRELTEANGNADIAANGRWNAETRFGTAKDAVNRNVGLRKQGKLHTFTQDQLWKPLDEGLGLRYY
jgi:hypothetical protein